MLSARLVQTIENHAEELTEGVIRELQRNPRTPAYHRLSREELHHRVYNVYRNLGRWIGEKNEAPLEAAYGELGRTRCAEGIALSEVVLALYVVKERLRDYIQQITAASSAIELYQEEELLLLIERFFDKAVYNTVRGYETAERSAAAKAPTR
jgi:hypothetical protein